MINNKIRKKSIQEIVCIKGILGNIFRSGYIFSVAFITLFTNTNRHTHKHIRNTIYKYTAHFSNIKVIHIEKYTENKGDEKNTERFSFTSFQCMFNTQSQNRERYVCGGNKMIEMIMPTTTTTTKEIIIKTQAH